MPKANAKPRANQAGSIPETSKFKTHPDGRTSVQWGQDAWLAIAEKLQPRRAELTPDLPRTAFARLVYEAALEAFPADERMHRSFDSLVVGTAPSSNYAVIRQTLAALDKYEKALARKAKWREQKASSRANSTPKLRVIDPPKPAPMRAAKAQRAAPVPAAPSPKTDALGAFLAMPVGNLLPVLRVLMAGVVADAFAPTLTTAGIPTPKEDTEPAAPIIPMTPPAPAPAPQPDTPETVAAKVELAMEVMELAVENLVLPVMPVTQPKPVKVKAAHSLADQLEAAAPIIGLDAKRKHVVVCGLHPKVMQDLEHKHHEFRFTYIKQDHLNEADHIPASTDALILCRKKLNSSVMGAVRRYAIPHKSVANSLPAAEWALREIFDAVR